MLYKTALMHMFGRNAKRPFRSATLRLGALGIGALALDVLFAGAVQSAPASRLPTETSFFGGMVAVELVMLFSLYTTTAFTGKKHSSFIRLLLSWPLNRLTRIIVLLLPSLVLACLTLLLLGWPIGILLAKTGLSLPMIGLCVSAGTACAFGLTYSLPGRLVIRLCITIATLASQYRLTQLLLEQRAVGLALLAQCTIIGVLVAFFVYAIMTIERQLTRPSQGSTVRTGWLWRSFWFVKKLARSSPLAATLVISFGLSVGLAIISKRNQLTDITIVGLFAALLAGSCSSDIRGLALRDRPAEIAALRGVSYFMRMQLMTALLCGACLALPIAAVLPVSQWFILAAQIALGISAGVLAGTLVVPKTRDIMSQFLALLIVLGILAGLPQLPPLSHASSTVQTNMHYMLAVCTVSVAFIIEYKRNPFTWRNRS